MQLPAIVLLRCHLKLQGRQGERGQLSVWGLGLHGLGERTKRQGEG